MTWPIAVVTGASSGIGRAIALELARRGHDLLCVGRDRAALEEGQKSHVALGVKSEIAVVDLSERDEVDEFASSLAERPVGILVNNAGFGVHGCFTDTDICDEVRLIEVQLVAMFALTKVSLPGMIERGRGRILNVASVYADLPVPGQAVYGACKASLASFSEALAEETRPLGITVTVCLPGITKTPFRSRQGVADKPSRFALDAEKVARHAVTALLAGRPRSVPGLGNRLLLSGSRVLPRVLRPRVVGSVNRRRGLGHTP